MVSKIKTFVKKPTNSNKNRKFGQNYKFLPEIKILNKNTKFGLKSKFWSKIKTFVNQKRNFNQKS